MAGLSVVLKSSNNSSFMDYSKDCQTPTPQTKFSSTLNGSLLHSGESGFDEDSKSNLSPSPLTNITNSNNAQSINYTPSLMMRNPSLILNSNTGSSATNYGQLLSSAVNGNSANELSSGCLTSHSAPANNTSTSLSDWYMQQSTGIPNMPTPPSNNSSPNSTSGHHSLNTTSHHNLHSHHHSHLNPMSFNHPHLNYTTSFHTASY